MRGLAEQGRKQERGPGADCHYDHEHDADLEWRRDRKAGEEHRSQDRGKRRGLPTHIFASDECRRGAKTKAENEVKLCEFVAIEPTIAADQRGRHLYCR
jgi:hypothetical protein